MHVPLAEPLPQEFFARDPLRVARDLLGCRLSHGGVTVRLTEVEAYAGAADPGSHAFLGRSPRNEVMFGPAGRLYVYFTYGMHFCANIVTGVEGEASAVLLRAGEVVDGHDVAAAAPARVPSARPGPRPGPARDDAGPRARAQRHGPGRPARRRPGRPRPEVLVEPSLVRTGPRVGVSGPGGDGVDLPLAVLGRRRPDRERLPPRSPGARRGLDPRSATAWAVRRDLGRASRRRRRAPGSPCARPDGIRGEAGVDGGQREVGDPGLVEVEQAGGDLVLAVQRGAEHRRVVAVHRDDDAGLAHGPDRVLLDPLDDARRDVARGADLERDAVLGEVREQRAGPAPTTCRGRSARRPAG